MEISAQSGLIYRLKGWRAGAIVLMKATPAIHHSGTASQSGGVFKDALRDRSSGRVGKPGGRGATRWRPPAERRPFTAPLSWESQSGLFRWGQRSRL